MVGGSQADAHAGERGIPGAGARVGASSAQRIGPGRVEHGAVTGRGESADVAPGGAAVRAQFEDAAVEVGRRRAGLDLEGVALPEGEAERPAGGHVQHGGDEILVRRGAGVGSVPAMVGGAGRKACPRLEVVQQGIAAGYERRSAGLHVVGRGLVRQVVVVGAEGETERSRGGKRKSRIAHRQVEIERRDSARAAQRDRNEGGRGGEGLGRRKGEAAARREREWSNCERNRDVESNVAQSDQ